MNKLYQILGLAMKAGKLSYGDKAIKSIQSKEAKLVLLTSDASDKTKKRITNKCFYYQIEVVLIDDSVYLSQSIGRSNCMYVSILEEGFAKEIKNCLK